MQYRKKPVIVEAKQMVVASGTNGNAHLAIWCNGTLSTDGSITIHTLEGDLLASPGDYIIKGVKGEFYPCKPDIFEQTYEPVEA